MMRSMSSMLADHHQVRIMDEAIVDSVKLSSRYITARQLPDKSVSLLDTACARVSLSQSATPAAIEDTQRRIDQIVSTVSSLEYENATSGNCEVRITELNDEKVVLQEKLEQQQEQWQQEKDSVARIQQLQDQIEQDFRAASLADGDSAEPIPKKLNDTERDSIKSEMQALTKTLVETQGNQPMIQLNVNGQAIAEVVSNWTGIPVGKMVSDEIHSILDLAETA